MLSRELDNVKLELTALALKVSLLSELARHEEARELADEVLERETSYKERAEDAAEMSVVQTQLADILWKGKQDKPTALKYLWRAISNDKWNQQAIDAIRYVRNGKSQRAKYFRVLLEGVWNELDDDIPNPGFIISYDVIADDAAEAMKFLKRFEPPPLRRSLIMRECEPLADWPDEPKGVYKTFPYHIFPRDNEEDGNHDN